MKHLRQSHYRTKEQRTPDDQTVSQTNKTKDSEAEPSLAKSKKKISKDIIIIRTWTIGIVGEIPDVEAQEDAGITPGERKEDTSGHELISTEDEYCIRLAGLCHDLGKFTSQVIV